MSLPSINSLGTVYGSCVNSDAESVLSHHTYRSVKSDSTLFYSGDSDTETLVDDKGSSDSLDNFYDVIDENDDDVSSDDVQFRQRAIDSQQTLVTTLSATDFRSSTPVAISGSASTETSEIILFRAQPPSTSSYPNRRTPIPPETNLGPPKNRARNAPSRNTSPVNQVKNQVCPPSDSSNTSKRRRPSELDERSQLLGGVRIESPIEIVTESADNIQHLRSIDTRIQAARSPCQAPPTGSSTTWRAKLIVPMYVTLMLCCSLGVQLGMRFNPHLNSWTLTFWRSLLQLTISPLFLVSTNQKLFGPTGSRLKVLAHVILGSFSVFAMLYSGERLMPKTLFPIFWSVPAGAMLLELSSQRSPMRPHFNVFVMVVWVMSLLLLSKNLPWPKFTDSSNQTHIEERWQPPIFGLDSVHFWPVQPSVYSREKNVTNEEVFFDESQKLSGIILAFFGLLATSITPVMTTACSGDVIGPVLIWQAVGACAVSTTGLLLHGHSFLMSSAIDWVFAGIISSLGFVSNFLMLKVLTLKRDKSRNGWTDQTRFEPAVTIGIVTRSAIEIVSVAIVNFAVFSGEAVSVEDGVGLTLLLSVAMFCCWVRPSADVLNGSQTSAASCISP